MPFLVLPLRFIFNIFSFNLACLYVEKQLFQSKHKPSRTTSLWETWILLCCPTIIFPHVPVDHSTALVSRLTTDREVQFFFFSDLWRLRVIVFVTEWSVNSDRPSATRKSKESIEKNVFLVRCWETGSTFVHVVLLCVGHQVHSPLFLLPNVQYIRMTMLVRWSK